MSFMPKEMKKQIKKRAMAEISDSSSCTGERDVG